jgi:hypothetical protein
MPAVCPQYARKMTLEPFNLEIGEEQRKRYLKHSDSMAKESIAGVERSP